MIPRFNWQSLWRRLWHAFKGAIARLRAWRSRQSRVAQASNGSMATGESQQGQRDAGVFPEFQQGSLRSMSRLEELPSIQTWFEGCMSGLTHEQQNQLQLAIAEAFTNAVRHAHRNLDERTPIELHVIQRQTLVELEVWDRGQPFDLMGRLTKIQEDFADGDPMEKESGRGLLFIHRLVDSMDYQRVGDRNCLLLSKNLTAPSSRPSATSSGTRPG